MQRVCFLSLTFAVGMLGCSDPVPPGARASLSMSLLNPSSNISPDTCDVGAATYVVGDPAPTTTDPGQRLVDGDPNVRNISCTVKSGDGVTFSVSGQLSVDNGRNQTAGTVARVAFNLNAGTLTTMGTGTARISVTTPDVGSIGGDECTLAANTGELQVAPGRVWASFSCPLLHNTSSPGKSCTASGIFVFENCVQE